MRPPIHANSGAVLCCAARLSVFALKRRLLLIKVNSSCKHGPPRPPAGIDIGGGDAVEATRALEDSDNKVHRSVITTPESQRCCVC